MKYHPAGLMLRTWLIAALALIVLPFQLIGRYTTTYGYMTLGLFIAVFCLSALLASGRVNENAERVRVRMDFKWADRILRFAAIVTLIAFMYELVTRNVFNLSEAYDIRGERVAAMLSGDESGSGPSFQLIFLFNSAGFAYLVREIGFSPKIRILPLAIYGYLPTLAASLVLGGRSPLLFALVLTPLAFGVRRRVFNIARVRRRMSAQSLGLVCLGGIGALAALNYFATVFIVRAETAGGVDMAFDQAYASWGVSFEGMLSRPIFVLLGRGNAYLLFAFAWYIVQGIVVANEAFSHYFGPPHLGIYGLDLGMAIMRRIDGAFVASRLTALLDLNILGFLPSAYGSLFIDAGLAGGLVLTAVWGWFAGFVYRRVQQGADPRWLLVAPFITIGIIFSLINTPLGFNNGLMTHFWLLAVFIGTRVRVVPLENPSPSPAG